MGRRESRIKRIKMTETDLGEKRVLLVEDDEDHAELIRRAIGSDCQLTWFRDGESALRYLYGEGEFAVPDSTNHYPHVILLDLRLGSGKDGLEVLEEIKLSDRARALALHLIPVVVLTTSEEQSDVNRALDAYVNSYLTKPVGIMPSWKELSKDIVHYWLELDRHVAVLPPTAAPSSARAPKGKRE
jgi:CheY-like chemotaxis protein